MKYEISKSEVERLMENMKRRIGREVNKELDRIRKRILELEINREK